MTKLRAIIKADSLTTTWEVSKELCWPFCGHCTLEANWKVKKLYKWVLRGTDYKSKKTIVLKCCLLMFYATTMNHFSVELWYATKSGLYMITGNDQLNSWTKKKPQSSSQSQTCIEKGHSPCLVVCHLSDSLQLFESQGNHYIWDICSANQWDAPKKCKPAAGIGQQKGPSSSPWQCPTPCCTTNTSKLKKLGYEVLPHLPYSPDLLLTYYHFFIILTTFCRENAFITSRTQKMPSKTPSNPEAQIFMLQE